MDIAQPSRGVYAMIDIQLKGYVVNYIKKVFSMEITMVSLSSLFHNH